ncbi:MAG: S1C family serine protease [Gaiellaceae bacterium]
MHRSTLPLSGAVGLIAAAVIGGAVALGGAALLGGVGGGTTTVRELAAATGSTEPTAFAQGTKLTIAEVYSRSAPGVVQVTSTSVTSVPSSSFFGNPFSQPQTQTQALGSGFVIDKAGHIITNYHVVQGAKSVEVSFNDNESLKARIVGVDPSTDIAVLQVDAHSRALTPLPLGNSDQIRVGDEVVAIGNPFGLDRSITSGIVSALQRGITAPNNYEIDHVIQTDAALNHGNSGGPLLNAQGQVIGVNSQIQTGGTTDGNVGVGFAIPINTVKTVVAQIVRSGHAQHAYIGISAKPIAPSIVQQFHLPTSHGLLVQGVQPGTGAAKAGLRGSTSQVTVQGDTWPLGGDIIVAADGVPVSSIAALRDAVAAKQPGDTVKLGIIRGTKKTTVVIKLGRQPASPQG